MRISHEKSETMAFKEKDAIKSEIVINEKIIEQINTSRYVGTMTTYWRYQH